MSSTTSLDNWAANRSGGEGSSALESDLTGDQDVVAQAAHTGFDDDMAQEGVENHDDDFGSESEGSASDAEARAAKKKKDLRTLLIAGGTVVGLVAAMGVFKLTHRAQGQVDEPAVAQVQQPAQQQDPSQVIAQVGVVQPVQPAVESPQPSPSMAAASGVAALDFGLQPQPQLQAQPQAVQPPAVAQQQVNQPFGSQVGAPPQAPIQAAQAVVAPSQSAVKPLAAPTSPSEAESLRAEMGSLRVSLEDRNRVVDQLRSELASMQTKIRQSAVAAQRPAPVLKAEVVKPVQKAEPARQEPAKPTIEKAVETSVAAKATPAATGKGKVRTDFRMYAYTDERFWIKGDDGESFMVGVGSPLPDGSRVTALNKDTGIVSTTAGDIK